MTSTHLISDFEGVEWAKLDDEEYLKGILLESCQKGNLTVLQGISWKFYPQGVTAMYLLSESHISIHTEPEFNKCHIDIYHCGGKGNVYVALNHLKEELKPINSTTTILQR